MPRIRVSLKTDEVRAEHPVEDLFATGETAEDFGGGEGGVDEEPDGGVGEGLAEEEGREEEVVVVHPD